MITISLTFESAEEAAAVLAKYAEVTRAAQTVKTTVAASVPSAAAAAQPAQPAPTMPTPPAPTVAEVTEAVQNVAAELDKHGVPYNPRLHSKSQSLAANGRWKMLRGASRNEFDAWHNTHVTAAPATAAPTAPQPVMPQTAAPQPGVPFNSPFAPPAAPQPAPTYQQYATKFHELLRDGHDAQELSRRVFGATGATDVQQICNDDGLRTIAYNELCDV